VLAGLILRLSQRGCQAAAGLRGEEAAGWEARGQRGRGAVPGAAAAVDREIDRNTVGQGEKATRNHTC